MIPCRGDNDNEDQRQCDSTVRRMKNEMMCEIEFPLKRKGEFDELPLEQMFVVL